MNDANFPPLNCQWILIHPHCSSRSSSLRFKLFAKCLKRREKKTPHYSHWMSNFQPSSSASVGDMWLYALHDKYFPASERLKVIDNVLVVWLPSLDVCKTKQIKFHFYSISILLLFFFQPHRSEQTFHRNQKGRKLKNARKGRIWRKRKTIPSAYNKSNFALDMLLRIHTHDFVVYQSISFFRSFFFFIFWNGFLIYFKHMWTWEHGSEGWFEKNLEKSEREKAGQYIFCARRNFHNIQISHIWMHKFLLKCSAK